MTKRRNKKQALMASILSLVLCVSMLLGTTMAWFTDTVTNKDNRIITGELGVELWKYVEKDTGSDYVNISDGTGDIFMTQDHDGERLNGILWEPGKTEVVLLQVKNAKSLALNYNIILDVKNGVIDETTGELQDDDNVALDDVLSYAIIPNVAGMKVEDANVAVFSELGLTSWNAIVGSQIVETDKVPKGLTIAAQNGALLAGESDYFALAVHMSEDASNLYQNQVIEIDVKLEAKQMVSEYDSFGNEYDKDAEFPVNTIQYYVSKTGSDDNPGTQDAPFATIEKANEVISATNHEGFTVEVLIDGGTYLLPRTIEFSGAEAGGTDRNKVIYRAEEGEEVIFTGFVDVSDVIKWSDVDETEVLAQRGALRTDVLPNLKKSAVGLGTYVKEALMAEYGNEAGAALYTELGGYKLFEMLFESDGTNEPGEAKTFTVEKNKNNKPSTTIQYLTLLVNGEEQDLAQWPNYGEYEVIETVVSKGGTTQNSAGAVFECSYDNIDTWGVRNGVYLARAFVRGFLSWNFREEWNQIKSIDEENDTITLKYYTDGGVNGGRNWRIVNLPQELDRPGEYYVDFTGSYMARLFYYPPYQLTKQDSIQISVVRDTTLLIENTSNIVFEGIEFSGFRNSDMAQGVITIKNSDNIEIRDCTFKHNDGGANVVLNGDNNTVEGCGFYNCGAAGVFLYGGGSYTTLEPQNNVISNNHFYNTGTGNLTNVGGAVTNTATPYYTGDTVGNVIKNNLIHHIYGAVSIQFNGVEYDISNNEISNGLRNLADYGLIYTGNRPYGQGHTVNYNYLHDFGSLTDTSTSVNGIYFDDWQSGQTAKNNIIVANSLSSTTGIFSVGAYNTMRYNILANSSTGILQGSRTNTLDGNNSGVGKFISGITSMSDALKTKYPFMLKVKENAVSGQPFPIIGNVITDNISYNAPNRIASGADTLLDANITNNLTVDTTDVFVDAANHDWRITSEYAASANLSENIMTEDNFSMDEIGIQKDVWAVTNPKEAFKLIYPKNGYGDVKPNDVVLNWEQALFADEYKYVVATDAEFANVVASGTSAYEYAAIGDLVTGNTYYWKVTAVNTTRQLGAEWESESGVYSFVVGKEVVKKDKLQETIAKATAAFAEVKDGTENVVGDFKVGTEAKLAALITGATAVYNNEDATQADVDAEVTKLQAAMDGIGAYKYKGYVTLDTSDASKWKPTLSTTTVNAEDGVLTITATGTSLDTKNVAYDGTIPSYNFLTFNMVPTLTNNSGRVCITFRVQDPSQKECWDGESYLLWILATGNIELQKNTPATSNPEMLKIVTNDGYIRDNVECNIKIEAIDLEGGGVQIIFKVDDQEIINFIDNDNSSKYSPIYADGTFAIQASKGSVVLKPAENIPTDVY